MKLLINTTSPYGRTAHITLLEKGFDFEVQYVNPWADDPDLLQANTAARVPALVLDNGQALSESMLIFQWAECERPDPSMLAGARTQALEISGVAMGVIEAAVHTLVGRVITSGALTETAFDEAPVGQRRRRSMISGLERLDQLIGQFDHEPFNLGVLLPIVALDYVAFRFPQASWTPQTPALDALRAQHADRASITQTMPRDG